MQNSITLPTIAIFDSSEDYLDIMQRFINARGFAAAPLHLYKVKSGEVDISDFIYSHNPQIILFDITFPYEENWQLYENVRRLAVCRGREFIITTPNIDALHDRIGEKVGAFQLVDKEIDLQLIVDCVNETWNKINHKLDTSSAKNLILS